MMSDPEHIPARPRPQHIQATGWSGGLRSARLRGRLYQIGAVLALVALAAYLGHNAVRAMTARGMQMGLGFLSEASGFTLAESILPFHSADSFAYAFLAGLGNTLWVSMISLVLATLLGVGLGIARLSGNWLVSRAAVLYIDLFRNTPQLIQIIFWYTLLTLLPAARQALHAGDWAYLSKRGLVIAWPQDTLACWIMTLAALAGLFATGAFLRWCDQRQRLTGRPLPAWRLALAGYGLFLLIVWWLLGAPTAMSFPRLAGFNFHGGTVLSPEFLALAMGLVLYFAAYIAEIVRAGITAVNKGQVEAARALNLNGARLYRRVILPQALRVAIPPISAQYISLMKTSALGVAIGYPELFNVSNSVMTLSGHTLECVFIMGAIYLLLALCISGIMNLFNRHIVRREATR